MSVRLSAPALPERPRTLDLSRLRTRAARVLQAMGHARSELSIALVSDEEIAELNSSWRGRRGSTDVLSFSLFEGAHSEHRRAMLGDIVIGLPTAQRQARSSHRSLDEEVVRLLIHGLLHLLGHDHEKNTEASVMRSEERRIRRYLRVAENR